MSETPAHFHAALMRNLDENIRNALIAQADNVVDARDKFEKRSVPWDMIDDGPFMILDPDDFA